VGVEFMRVDESSGTPNGPGDEPGTLADVYRAIERLKGRTLEDELAGLRRARQKLLAAVPKAAERARLAKQTVDSSDLGGG